MTTEQQDHWLDQERVVDWPMPLPALPQDNQFKPDMIAHPPHYTKHPSGIECIEVAEHMNFNLGNVVKYLWRADLKDKPLEDLEKALWYLKREIKRRRKMEE